MINKEIKKGLVFFYIQSRKWLLPMLDPVYFLRGLLSYPGFFIELFKYHNSSNSERLNILDLYPQIHDRTKSTAVDKHYFYTNGWAMRRIVNQKPRKHLDIGSQTMFVNLLSSIIPVIFIDYRPLEAFIEGLTNIRSDILELPFKSEAVESLSCLHVAEHIGLGRYGDPINPKGTYESARELARVLIPGGNLFFVVPVGKSRVCFNAHRIHQPKTILEFFFDLKLIEFSGVHDDGRFVENVELDTFDKSDYACGMFWFKKYS